MTYKDNLSAAMAQNDALAAELKKAQERVEKTGPQEIPDLDDVMLEFLMGWDRQVYWPKNGWTVLVTDKDRNGDPTYGIAFRPQWRSVEINVVQHDNLYNKWKHYRDLHIVKGKKGKILKQALTYYYVKRHGSKK